MERIILTTPEELKTLIRGVLEDLKFTREEKSLPENLDLDQALNCLNQNGYPTSKGKMYQLTHRQEIPFKKYCNKLVFERKKLLEWARNYAKDPSCTLEEKEIFYNEAIKRSKRSRQ